MDSIIKINLINLNYFIKNNKIFIIINKYYNRCNI